MSKNKNNNNRQMTEVILLSKMGDTQDPEILIDVINESTLNFEDPVIVVEDRVVGYNTYSVLIMRERKNA
jgi:hypothetical protein